MPFLSRYFVWVLPASSPADSGSVLAQTTITMQIGETYYVLAGTSGALDVGW